MKYLYILLLWGVMIPAMAQNMRRNSRHYIQSTGLPERVEPLLSDSWHQYGAPFNNKCPKDKDNLPTMAGCVALAMGQVMHYWQWPGKGVGKHTYTDSLGCGKTLTANFPFHEYQWQKMPDHFVRGEYNYVQADEVAKLLLDCGITVDMRYGAESSGAKSIKQCEAMANHFRYNRGVEMLFKDFYSYEETLLMLKTELAEGRPVLISGYSATLAHAFVIDGYDEEDRFHIRLGNPDNDGDGWTPLAYMVPDQPEWYDHDSPERGMNLLQSFTINLMPENRPQATNVERHNFGMSSVKAVHTDNEREWVWLSVHNLSNLGWNTLEDSVALMLRKGDSIVCPIYVYDHDFALEEIDDTTYTDTLLVAVPREVEDGVYTIVPMYRDNAIDGNGKEWREVRTCTGTPNYLIANVTADSVTLSSDTTSMAYLSLEWCTMPDMLIKNEVPDYEIAIKNHNCEIAGRVYVALESPRADNKSALTLIQEVGVSMAKDEEIILHFKRTPLGIVNVGTYTLRILYEKDLFSDELIDLPLPEEQRKIRVGRASEIQVA